MHSVAAIRTETSGLRSFFDSAYPELARRCESAGVVPTGCRAYYFSAGETFDVAAFVIDDADRDKLEGVLDFPAGEVARARYEGTYDQLGPAWDSFAQALVEMGDNPVTDLYCYLADES